MRLLLDSHTFLWFIGADPKLSDFARESILAHDNERLLSLASLWEITIKASLGKLKLHLPLTRLVEEHVEGNAIALLQIEPRHLDVLSSLPFHHRDPFDRLIVAQGLADGLPVVSKDKTLSRYGIERLWSRPS
ncbi:MAG: type II toxin-antitoxin system VapC family toxin [Acidobacteriota bacterium]